MRLSVRIGKLITNFQNRADKRQKLKLSLMSTIPRGVYKYLEAYIEPHSVIPITPFPIESVTPLPFQILSPHLGADRYNQPFF
jgi:hypothetical protein